MSVPVTDLTDSQLIRRCAVQDQAAFRVLYDMWGGRMYGVALRITRDPALAADATHDAFVQVWQRACQFDPSKGEGGSWLMTLARYRALDIVRRGARESPRYRQLDDEPCRGRDPLASLVATTEGEALYRSLQFLSGSRRQLIVLAFLEGFSHSEVATHLNLPIGTVKSSIRRALAALKDALGHKAQTA